MRGAEILFVILLVACGGCNDDDDPGGASGGTVEVRNAAGDSATVQVEIARTAEQRRVGLMHRQSLAEDAGMLFIFDEPSTAGFWMQNTLVPLDIAYIAADGTLLEIREGVPLNEEVLFPAAPYLYALEVNRGWFASNGFAPGDQVVIPSALLTPQPAVTVTGPSP